VHRVICRDPDSRLFDRELQANHLSPAFHRELEQTVENTRRLFPELHLAYANNALDASVAVSERPAFYADDLPAGCCISDCIENPWETLNIYANGDVVACGCRSAQEAFGNLNGQSLAEIWHGPAFRRFREQYFLGLDESCRHCPWKIIFLPSGFGAELPQGGGWSWQLLRGWYHEEGAPSIWSKREAVAFLNSSHSWLRPKLSIQGALPNPDPASENRLEIFCNGIPAGEITSKGRGMLEFTRDIPIPRGADPPYFLRFVTSKYYCPNEHEGSPDIRKLGFVLHKVSVTEAATFWSKMRN